MTSHSDAESEMEERVYNRLLTLVNTKLAETIKENLRPVLDDLLQSEDSVFDASTYTVKSPHSPALRGVGNSLTESSRKLVDIEENVSKITDFSE